jgi:hypothetical protein
MRPENREGITVLAARQRRALLAERHARGPGKLFRNRVMVFYHLPGLQCCRRNTASAALVAPTKPCPFSINVSISSIIFLVDSSFQSNRHFAIANLVSTGC